MSDMQPACRLKIGNNVPEQDKFQPIASQARMPHRRRSRDKPQSFSQDGNSSCWRTMPYIANWPSFTAHALGRPDSADSVGAERKNLPLSTIICHFDVASGGAEPAKCGMDPLGRRH